VVIAIAILATAPKAHARGWEWFRHHIRPTGGCSLGEKELILSIYWHGRMNADGSHFNPHGLSAAHRHLPFGTHVTIRNPKNQRSVTVEIKDRGPFIAGVSPDEAIDLSLGAATALGMTASQYGCMS
jgi:hypothetical protein